MIMLIKSRMSLAVRRWFSELRAENRSLAMVEAMRRIKKPRWVTGVINSISDMMLLDLCVYTRKKGRKHTLKIETGDSCPTQCFSGDLHKAFLTVIL